MIDENATELDIVAFKEDIGCSTCVEKKDPEIPPEYWWPRVRFEGEPPRKPMDSWTTYLCDDHADKGGVRRIRRWISREKLIKD